MPQTVAAHSGLSSTGAVWHRLKIQAFTAGYVWEITCRETVLIGNLPTRLMPLPRHAFRRGALCFARPQSCLGGGPRASDLGQACPWCCRGCCTSRRLPSADWGTSLRGMTAGRGREGLWKTHHALHIAEAMLGLAHRLCHHARSHARRVATSRTGVRRGEHRTDVVHRRAAMAEKP